MTGKSEEAEYKPEWVEDCIFCQACKATIRYDKDHPVLCPCPSCDRKS